jgi:hypothetical protein
VKKHAKYTIMTICFLLIFISLFLLYVLMKGAPDERGECEKSYQEYKATHPRLDNFQEFTVDKNIKCSGYIQHRIRQDRDEKMRK